MSVLVSAEVNKSGVGTICLHYGYSEAAEKYRALISLYSTSTTTYVTYPAVNIFKRYVITIFIHHGLKKVHTEMLGILLKGGNPELKGMFMVIDCRTLTADGKENCKVLLLDFTPEFL